MWEYIIDYYDVEVSTNLFNLPDSDFVDICFGAKVDVFKSTEDYEHFIILIAKVMSLITGSILG